MNAKDFEEVNKELNLILTSDWGIINADAKRVKEFINYTEVNKMLLDTPTKFGFIELIIASMNEAILEGSNIDEYTKSLFVEYIYTNLEIDKGINTSYWISIADEEEFPVGFLLNEILNKEI